MDTNTFIRYLVLHTIKLENGVAIGGSEVAEILTQLIALEVAPGGPYVLPETRELDIGFNLVIANFLHACGVHLSQLASYIDKSISEKVTSRVFNKKELKELLKKYESPPEIQVAATSPPLSGPASDNLLIKIRERVFEVLGNLPLEARSRAQALCDRIVARNSDRQIPLISYFVRHALGKRGASISDEQVIELGAINVAFWSAIKVYDDFWDEDETADPKLLPIANFLLRKHMRYFYEELGEYPVLVNVIDRLMDLLDGANAWETVSCRMRVEGSIITLPERLPDYGEYVNKFYPAIGQTFGPLSIMSLAGYSLDDPSVLALLNYFEHCLIAMQLNDDAHDWQEDLKRGHISTAVALLLSKWCEKYSESTILNLDTELSQLAEVFWFETLREICDLIIEHTQQARSSLDAVGFADTEPLEWFIHRNESSAERSRAELTRTEAFMKRIGDKFSFS